MPSSLRRSLVLLSLLPLPVALLVAAGGGAALAHEAKATSTVTSTSLGSAPPTFTGPAATGCASAGCSLLSGPLRAPSTAGLTASPVAEAAAAKEAAAAAQLSSTDPGPDATHVMPAPGGHSADLGQAPTDGFSEYQGYPGPTRPRWGDYSWAIFAPWSGGKIDFATNYIQYPNCTGAEFTLTLATCGGTRDGNANWGTSVNYVVP